MKQLRFSIILAFLAFALAAAAQVKFSLVNPRPTYEGQRFTITFRLSNATASAPKAPEIPNCTLLYGPSTSTMQSTQIINGQMSSSSSVDYTFTYRADKASTVTIPAVSVDVDGKKLSSSTAQLTIYAADKAPQQQQPSHRIGDPTTSQRTNTASFSADDMFVRISLNRSSVYEQEAIVATVKVYTRREISSFQITSQPTFEGFLSEELNVDNSTQVENYNGKEYYTAMLKRCIIYPQKSGTLTINSGKYDVTLVDYDIVSNGFFQTRRPVEKHVTTQSNTATVKVLPLPEPKPASFNGAVGNFSASVELKPEQLRTNETSAYIINITGTGNIKYLKAPTLDLPASIDQYTPKTDIKADFTGSDMKGSYSINFTLVPQDPGTFDIPARQFTYFNPQDKQYHSIDLNGFTMKVAQGASVSSSVEQKAINKSVTDIRHIRPIGKLSHDLNYTYRSGIYWLLYILAATALIAIFFIYRRHLKLNADVRGRKLARANKQANRRLKEARAAMAAHQSEKFYAELNRAMWGYLSDKLGIPASQLLRDNISSQLTEYGLGTEAVDGTITVLDECEMARFTPEHSDSEMQSLYEKAVAVIKSIENVKK